jgi:hypothetical protein
MFTLLLLCSPAFTTAEELPDDIWLRDLQHGFSYEYLYALKDGRIWIKPNTKNTGVTGQWQLFNKTGLPYGKHPESFEDGHRITQLSTEGTMLAAVSDRGRFYLWQPTYFEETHWRDETGAPFADTLYLPENKTWCFAFSTMTAPWKRKTPMHEKDIVTYWEDIDGNKTEFGFTATIYAVTPDGQKIRFTDTGLPASWGKAITSPERGRFIIENMCASASVIFVINKTGRMYTRMYDFELDGGCPALRFTYDRGKRTVDDEIAPLMTSIRTHPLPGWREQEPVSELFSKGGSGKAAITSKITIVLTGRGNAERELRVQGRNSRGEYGYWKKMLYGSRWGFVVTGEKFNDEDIIKNYLEKAHEGKSPDKDYAGTLSRSGETDLKAELLGFYYFNTPATLRIHVNSKHFDMILHTVDLWSPTVQKKNHPDLVGHPSGEPKLLQGAIEIPDELLNSSDPEIKSVVDKYFREFNKEPIAFTISADDRRVSIESKTLQRSLRKNLSYEFRGNVKFDLINENYRRDFSAKSIFLAMAENPELDIPADTSAMTANDTDKLVVLNEKALDDIRRLKNRIQRESCATGCVSSCILPVYYIFNSCVTILGIPHWDMSGSSPGTAENITQLGGVSYTGGTPLKEHAVMNLREGFDNPEDYDLAVELIENRLYKLRIISDELKQK